VPATAPERPDRAITDRPTVPGRIASHPPALWSEFRRTGVAGGTIRFDFADGRPRELAYPIVADDPVDGRHPITVRVVGAPDEGTG